MSNKPGFFRQLKDTQNYSTKFLIVLFSPNSGVTPDNNKKMGSRDWNVDFWKGQTYNLGEERLASYLTNLN